MIICTLIITTYDKVYYRQAPLPLSYPYNHVFIQEMLEHEAAKTTEISRGVTVH